MAETNISMKVCTKCKVQKDVSNFNNDRTRKDGKFPHCRECAKAHLKEMYQKHKAKRSAYGKEDYLSNKDEYKARAKKWVAANPEKRKEVAKKYVENNAEQRFLTQQEHRKKNSGVLAAHYKMRQQKKRQAIPSWADLVAIKALYVECAHITKETGIEHHVDHYYPLTSDIVCGLHCEDNLRIIPAAVNLSKGNKVPK